MIRDFLCHVFLWRKKVETMYKDNKTIHIVCWYRPWEKPSLQEDITLLGQNGWITYYDKYGTCCW